MKAICLLAVVLIVGCGSPSSTAVQNPVPAERPGMPEGATSGKGAPAKQAPASNSSSSVAPAN